MMERLEPAGGIQSISAINCGAGLLLTQICVDTGRWHWGATDAVGCLICHCAMLLVGHATYEIPGYQREPEALGGSHLHTDVLLQKRITECRNKCTLLAHTLPVHLKTPSSLKISQLKVFSYLLEFIRMVTHSLSPAHPLLVSKLTDAPSHLLQAPALHLCTGQLIQENSGDFTFLCLGFLILKMEMTTAPLWLPSVRTE